MNAYETLISNPTITNLKYWYKETFPELHLFDAATMRFFGAKSKGVKIIDGIPYYLEERITSPKEEWRWAIWEFNIESGHAKKVKGTESEVKSIWRNLKKELPSLEFGY